MPGKPRARWPIGIAVAIAVIGAAAALLLTRLPKSVVVHTAVAQSDCAAAAGSAAGASVLDASGYVVAMREATVSAKSIYKVNEVLIEEARPSRRAK